MCEIGPGQRARRTRGGSASATLGFILGCVLTLSLSSCAQHMTLTSPAQLSRLPTSQGLNDGSYVAETSWQYRGSRNDTHEFFCYYHTGNLLHRREVSIPRSVATLHFREVPFNSERLRVTLQPDSTAFQFNTISQRSPAVRWVRP